MSNQDPHEQMLPPFARNAARRIRDGWDRATATTVLGAIGLAVDELLHSHDALISEALAQEPDPSPSDNTVKHASNGDLPGDQTAFADETAANETPAAQPAVQPNPDSGDGAPEVGKDAAAEDDKSSADHHGSSTSRQIIDESLREPIRGLHEVSETEAAQAAPVPSVELTTEIDEEDNSGLTINGSAGDDIIIGSAGTDVLIGGAGNDDLHGKGGNDTLRGGDGDDKLSGGSGDDDLQGDSGNDSLQGDGGADELAGGSGADSLEGGSGDDVLIGGLGVDQLAGGEGSDSFKFVWVDESGPTADNRDHILDFTQGVDRIDLSSINAESDTPEDQAFHFVGLADFGKNHLELRFGHIQGSHADEIRTLIEADTDGDGHANLQIELHGLFTMTADDFLL